MVYTKMIMNTILAFNLRTVVEHDIQHVYFLLTLNKKSVSSVMYHIIFCNQSIQFFLLDLTKLYKRIAESELASQC